MSKAIIIPHLITTISTNIPQQVKPNAAIKKAVGKYLKDGWESRMKH
jgi:hypothetical protein